MPVTSTPVDLTNAQRNESNPKQIGVKRNQPRPYFISGEKTVTGNAYVFSIRANISFSWVEEEDIQKVLKIEGGCCGGKRKIFLLANEDDVRRWTNGGGR